MSSFCPPLTTTNVFYCFPVRLFSVKQPVFKKRLMITIILGVIQANSYIFLFWPVLFGNLLGMKYYHYSMDYSNKFPSTHAYNHYNKEENGRSNNSVKTCLSTYLSLHDIFLSLTFTFFLPILNTCMVTAIKGSNFYFMYTKLPPLHCY